MAAVPAWLRRAVPDAQAAAGQGLDDIAIIAGAAISVLDGVVRRHERWAGAWRQRLALSAAVAAARQAGRLEDEAGLRDAVLFTRPGDETGPAGQLLLGWRRLAVRSAEDLLTEKNLAAVFEAFGHAPDEEVVSELVDELGQLSGAGMVATLTGAFLAAERHRLGRALGAWLTDALLAQHLGWAHAVPLLGTEAALSTWAGRSRQSVTISAAAGVETGFGRAHNLLAAQARAALRAIDLSAELGRRADKLLAIAPKLRAKAAGVVIERLLSTDAIATSEAIAGMSDRGLRRLFDRLVELGAVRELSGRPIFRVYGL